MKKRYVALIIILMVLLLGSITAKIFLARFEDNLEQLALSEIYDVDLTTAEDGIFIGSYSVFPVSVKVEVTIKNHSVNRY